MPNPIWFRIACESRPRGSRRATRTGHFDIYITKVDLAHGSTSNPTKIWHTHNKAEAGKFGKLTAQNISNALNGKGWGLSTKIEPIEES